MGRSRYSGACTEADGMQLNRNWSRVRGSERAGEAKLGDLTREAVCLNLRRGAVEMVGSKVVIECAVAQHVIDGGED